MQNLTPSHFDTLRRRYGVKSIESLLADALVELCNGRNPDNVLVEHNTDRWGLVVRAVLEAAAAQLEEEEK